ncbi:hypothetical protein [Blastococcus brunescens]|uniref:Transketolase N-terminal domain-containing protein n=1 Tax=Blastococcus brunescens TaxID=1564165 RepID=A0ABZ1B3X7_9ACTN|nr:hypothetical protein [Blastococcus sp. BMG 8361]WRL65444.1 hypothetical protein U6N30_07435 [Blastococcus sp. BMG 8361]
MTTQPATGPPATTASPPPAALRVLSVPDLEEQARQIRVSIIEMLTAAKSGHSAGPLGMAEILTVLYFAVMRHDPANPEWDKRDTFFLSNGHTAPVLYAALAHSGYFPLEELTTLRQLGSRLQGHPERTALPGLENTSGPLGSGLRRRRGTPTRHRSSIDRWTDSPMSAWATASSTRATSGRRRCSRASTSLAG